MPKQLLLSEFMINCGLHQFILKCSNYYREEQCEVCIKMETGKEGFVCNWFL